MAVSETDIPSPEFVKASDYDPDARQNKREMAREVCDRVGISYHSNYIPSSGNVSRDFMQAVRDRLRECDQ